MTTFLLALACAAVVVALTSYLNYRNGPFGPDSPFQLWRKIRIDRDLTIFLVTIEEEANRDWIKIAHDLDKFGLSHIPPDFDLQQTVIESDKLPGGIAIHMRWGDKTTRFYTYHKGRHLFNGYDKGLTYAQEKRVFLAITRKAPISRLFSNAVLNLKAS